ncbi:DMT family transporter [Spirochaetota bacterium]
MTNKANGTLRYEALLFITAAIWGMGFVAQRLGMNSLGPFSYNAARFFVGSLALIPVLILKKANMGMLKAAALPGLVAGTALFVASSFQQAGLVYTSAGKAGFITSLYVVLVPIAAIMLGKKTPLRTWIGAAFAFLGLYTLSFRDLGSINRGDILVFASAFFYTSHILILDKWTRKVEPIVLAFIQFAVTSVLCSISAAIFEAPEPKAFFNGILPVLYGGLFSIGIAYTLQAIVQSKAHPAKASIILSLEAAFALIGGMLFLKERLTLNESLGCLLMLTGTFIAEWPGKKK